MQKQLLFLLFTCTTIFSQAQKPDAVIDVLSYQFSLKLSDSTDRIEGEARIRFKATGSTKSITLNLIKGAGSEKGMTVSQVREESALSFTHDRSNLRIGFQQALTPGTEHEVTVYYSGIPADGLIIGKNKYGHRGFFADNWPDRARNWLPCVDHPADKAAVTFIITAPLHYQVVANGKQTEETNIGNGYKLTRFDEKIALPTKVMVIGVADFAVQEAGVVNCVPVQSWIYPEDREKGFADYAAALEVLPYYNKQIGPYAYPKLANVQSKTRFGGLENASAIFYYENSVTGKKQAVSLIAHEIAHQWFGNMATEAEWAHIWLSEGFATYMTNLFMEHRYGRDTLVSMLIKQREEVIAFSKGNKGPVVDSSITDYMNLLNPNSYQKAGWVLHMLHVQLGDSLFWAAVRNYYKAYAGGNAVTEDFQRVVEETSGKKLGDFFRQWLYRPGIPLLSVSSKYDEKEKMFTLTILQKQETPFDFPLEIQLQSGSDGAVLTKSVHITQQQTTVKIPFDENPAKVRIDPACKLLAAIQSDR